MVTENETAFFEPEPASRSQSSNISHYVERFVFDKKVELTAEGLIPFYERLLRERTTKENAITIADYNTASLRPIFLCLREKIIYKH